MQLNVKILQGQTKGGKLSQEDIFRFRNIWNILQGTMKLSQMF